MKINSGYITVKIIKKLIVPVAILGLATVAYSKIGLVYNTAPAESGISKDTYNALANKDEKIGYVPVNGNHSTLKKSLWKVNKVQYQKLDSLGRTSGSNTAYLEKRNLADQSLRVRQYVKPSGWSVSKDTWKAYNRGHLIAYSVSAGISQSGKYSPKDKSGDQNNPRNLFTQTAYSNQKVQTIFEAKVRKALAKGDKVIYQATPIFKGSDKMARGINLQAVSVNNNDLDFNVYIFNSQPGYVFDYSTGQSKYNGKTNTSVADTIKGSLNGLKTRYKQGQSVMQSAGKTTKKAQKYTHKGLNNAAWLSKKLASASSYFYKHIVKNQK